MTRALVHCFLETSPHKLERLELDNLLQWSEIQPPVPQFNNAQTMEAYIKGHSSVHKAVPWTHRMADTLRPFYGRFDDLKSLCISTVSECHRWQPISAWDHRRYSDWARCIDSVRQQLSVLCFKQGYDQNLYANSECPRPGIPWADHRPMDRLFKDWILPALLKDSWPQLKRMEIKGVGPSSPEELLPNVFLFRLCNERNCVSCFLPMPCLSSKEIRKETMKTLSTNSMR
jgi:hypothetical protein